MRQPLKVLFEDNHLIAINKISGVLVQSDETGDVTLADMVKQYIKEKYAKPGAVFLGVIHRIDRPVSGVVLFARTSKALTRMNELFRTRDIQKTYLAVVEGKPARTQETLIHWLIKNQDANRTSVYKKEKDGAQRCELTYQLLKSRDGLSLVKVKPITGRSHQIRAQLSEINCPIRGDVKYGASEGFDTAIGLHAHQLSFIHPVTQQSMIIEAPTPQNLIWQPFVADVT